MGAGPLYSYAPASQFVKTGRATPRSSVATAQLAGAMALIAGLPVRSAIVFGPVEPFACRPAGSSSGFLVGMSAPHVAPGNWKFPPPFVVGPTQLKVTLPP